MLQPDEKKQPRPPHKHWLEAVDFNQDEISLYLSQNIATGCFCVSCSTPAHVGACIEQPQVLLKKFMSSFTGIQHIC